LGGFFGLLLVITRIIFKTCRRRYKGAGRSIVGNLVSSLTALGGQNWIGVSGSIAAERGQSFQIQVLIPRANEPKSCIGTRACGRVPPLIQPGTALHKMSSDRVNAVWDRFPRPKAFEGMDSRIWKLTKLGHISHTS
jgi:hypothetical protein